MSTEAVFVNYQVRANKTVYPLSVICKCGCGVAFKPTFPRNVYATAGCANRAKLAGEKRRIQNKRNREKVA